jgi:8-oxo-dGTP pyrophosphatase MutT (NUDIX family)
MNEQELAWHEEGRKTLGRYRIFSVCESVCRSPEGVAKTFSVVEANDWAIVVPVIDAADGKRFVMVRQWRHGAQTLSLEFPGGVIEAGEDSAAGAGRELLEETGIAAPKLRLLGTLSPNPAFMTNQTHVFLAEDLPEAGVKRLDEDEFLDVETIPVSDVLRDMGKPPYIHALMAAALMLYLRETGSPQAAAN